METVSPVLRSRIFWNAALLGAGLALMFYAVFRYFGMKGCLGIVIALVIGLGGFFVSSRKINVRVDEMGNDISNVAINEGVSKAQEAHATQLQLIHANVSKVGVRTQQCQRAVNYRDFCASNTPWYTHREINVHYDAVEHCDSDGENCTIEYVRDWDDEYTPWFTYIGRYFIVVDTRVKYLHPGMYEIENSDQPKDKPIVFLTGWRAPEDVQSNILLREHPGQYDNRVPSIWLLARERANNGEDAVLATFVGKYFHWLHADESAQYMLYEGHYEQLKTLVSLPGPQGVVLTLKDAYGKEISVKSDLYGDGNGPALDYRPITDLAGIDSSLLEQLNEVAANLQGDAGPKLQASIRWFIVRESVVQKMGGSNETVHALKAYLADETVWGLFSLPKNVIIELIVVNDSGCITARNMETGMPFGNVLVAQDHRMSIPAGSECIPLTAENAIGIIDGHYVNNDPSDLQYVYPDLTLAGGATSILYQKTPGYVSPDPDSEECSSTPPEHHGFIRYSMCTQEYRKSNIELDNKDIQYILDGAVESAKQQTRIIFGLLMFVVGLVLCILSLADEN